VAIEDLMGLILFIFGVVLMVVAFLAATGVTEVIQGLTILWFAIFGFILCVTGFLMARSAVGGMMTRFRR